MTDRDEPLELAERALGFADGEAQATVVRERSLLSRFAVSRPTQATEVDDLTVSVLCVDQGHTGSAETNATTDEALREVAARARAAARAAAGAAGEPGDYPGLPAPAPAPRHDGFDARTAQLDPATAGEALSVAFERCAAAGLQAFGIWTAGAVDTAIASSTGVRALDSVTDAFMKVIARHESGRSGWAAGTGSSIAALDPDALATRAAAKVTREEPIELAPGEYPVVLEHDAVGSLLEFLGGLAFDGLAHTEGRGALVGRLGERVAAPSIDLTDSPQFAGTLPRAVDAEGVPKHALPLIQDGVAQAVVHDTRSAARAGTTSTGHALAPGGSAYGPAPTNLVLTGGGGRRRGRADGADRARPLRDAPVVPQRRAPEVHAGDRDHARRHLPHRGRPHRAPAQGRALHRLDPAPARDHRGAHRDPAARLRGRVLRAALRRRRRHPGAARAGLQDHRADVVSGSARHIAASAATGSGANWPPTRRSHSARASSRERAAE